MVITAIMLGAKYQDDKRLANIEFGRIGGVQNQEINLLEVNFLETIGFNLWVSPEMFNGYLQVILNADANYERNINLIAVELSRKGSDQSSKSKSDNSDSNSTSEKTPVHSTSTEKVEEKIEEVSAIGGT